MQPRDLQRTQARGRLALVVGIVLGAIFNAHPVASTTHSAGTFIAFGLMVVGVIDAGI